MSLTTRCSACATVFRVVQDQLRVSEGWVRCGRCGEVFNAIEGLLDVGESPAPAPAPVASPPASQPADEVVATVRRRPAGETQAAPPQGHRPASAGVAAGEIESAPGKVTVDIEIEPAAQATATPALLVAASPPAARNPTPPAAAASPEPEPEDDFFRPPVSGASSATAMPQAEADRFPDAEMRDSGPPPPDSDLADPDPGHAPSFVRRAERAARWRHPAVRATLAVLALAGAAGLAAQVAYFQRDWVGASLPALRPVLARACDTLGCSVGELRQIESLSVESSGLVRIEGTSLYRLSMTLRNRANLEVAAPAVDLTLTDAQGQLISRRVLAMADLGVPSRTLRPAAELPIQVSLGVGDRVVSGYTVEIFYP